MASSPGTQPTPPALAERLVCRVLDAGPCDGGLLDPACGAGALLLAAWRVGRARGLRPERLFGIECDPGRAREARRALAAAIGGDAGARAARNVVVGDALDPEGSWPAGTSVIANPPWVSFSGRRSAQREGGAPAGGRGWPSLHGAFLERIARHVGDQRTRAALLLPASVGELPGYGPLRCEVTRRARPLPPVELGEDAFPGVIEPAILVELRPRLRAGRGSETVWSLFDGRTQRLLEALADHPRLGPECFGDPGVHTGNAARELVLAGEATSLPGVREGRDLAPWRLGPARRRLNVHLARADGRRFRIGPLERYRSVPVLVRQTADRPRAALHTDPTYFRNTLLACTPPPELDPAFVVAVLNSPVVAAWHRRSFGDARQRAFPQVKVGHLRTAPFPLSRRDEDRRLHDTVVRLVRQMALEGPGPRQVQRVVELVREAFDLPRDFLD